MKRKEVGSWGAGGRGECTLTLKSAFFPSSQVCELDIIFNFEKAYFILDEFLMGGDVQDTSKKSVLKAIEQADLLQEVRARDSEEEEEYHDRGGPSFPGQLACQPQLPPSGRQGDPPACGVWPPRRLPGWPACPQALTDCSGWEAGVAGSPPVPVLPPSPKTQDVSPSQISLVPYFSWHLGLLRELERGTP